MTQLTLERLDRKITIDSREVAKMVEKKHSELLKDIRRYIGYLAEGEIHLGDFFIETTYTDTNNQERPCYLVTKQGCEMVANKLTGKKGTLFTAEYIKRFNEMEIEIQPSYMITDPIERAEKWIEEQKEVQQLEEQNQVQSQLIAEYKPIITYYDTILNSKDTVTVSQVAADYGLSAIELNKILHEEGVQRKVNGQWILYKQHMQNGYTKSQTHVITLADGREKTVMNTRWTQKGRLLIHQILEDRGINALMDKEV